MDGYSKIAKLFKERDNVMPLKIEVATVIAGFPDIKLMLDNNKIVLDKEDLLFSSAVLKDHQREYVTKYNGRLSNQRTIIFKDYSIKLNDEVLVLPLYDNQKYFILDKVVKL